MKTKIFLLVALIVISVSACKNDDDKVKSPGEPLTSLEGKLNQMNADINAISVIVNALQNNVYISSVDQTENGYRITFADEKEITIKEGKSDKDNPAISINESEGFYYWVQIIDNVKSWLTDKTGNKIPATGTEAVIPILKVNTERYWTISYDKGITDEFILDENNNQVKAVSKNDADNEIKTDEGSFFKSIKVEDDVLVLVLVDDTVLKIPMMKEDDTEGTASVKGSVDLDDLEGLTVQSLIGESVLSKKDFSLKVLSNELPQLIYVADKDSNIVMMARGFFQNQPAEINAKSSALALISMLPPFICDNKEVYEQIADFITKSPDFLLVENEMDKVIKAKKDIFSHDNTTLFSAIESLVKNLFDKTKTKSFGIEITGIDSDPLKVTTYGSTVSICNTGLKPPYECQVYYGGEEMEELNNIIPSPDSHGFCSFITGDIGEKHEGQAINFHLKKQGSYNFNLDKTTKKACETLGLTLFSDVLNIIGGALDLENIKYVPEFLFWESLGTSIITGTTEPKAMDIVLKILGHVGEIIRDKGWEWFANTYLKKYLKEEYSWKIGREKITLLSKKITIYYNCIKAFGNESTRCWQAWFAPNSLNFNLCYYYDNDNITSCTKTDLSIISGNNQKANPGQKLVLPLTVSVKTIADDGSVTTLTGYQKIKFEVISGYGFVEDTFVDVDPATGTASTYWTLGTSGEQTVQVFAFGTISETVLSQPVYFTAYIENNNQIITGNAENITATSVTLSGTVIGYDVDDFSHPYGICYSTNVEPTSENGTIVKASNIQNGNFSVQLTSGLEEGQTYYWRAYVRNAGEYVYGDVKSFTTDTKPNNERDILVAFYNATGGDNWINKENWCTNAPLDDWYGISTDQNGNVAYIDLNRNNLTGNGNLSGLKDLFSAQFIENQLTGLNMSNCTNLELLDCRNNKSISNLNLSGCTALEILYARDNQLTELILSNCVNLQSLSCGGNKLTTLNLSQNVNLTDLECSNNPLTSLNITGCTQLSTITCNNTRLSGNIDLSNRTKLKYLWLTNNQLTGINASNCPILEYIMCEKNQLKSINIKGCTGMALINCTNNSIETFYLDKDPVSFKYNLWGDRNSSSYLEPNHKNGYQYPEFIYQ